MNSLELHARERAGHGDGWQVCVYERMPPSNTPCLYYSLKGAVYPPLKSGPRKGRTNVAKPSPGTEETVIITPAEHESWLAAWGARTGRCIDCLGKGEKVQSWSKAEGTKYKPCRACGGDGKYRERRTA